MFRAPALVVIVAVSLAAGRPGHLCGVSGLEGHPPPPCHHAGGLLDAAVWVAGDREGADVGAARRPIPSCADVDGGQDGIQLQWGWRVRRTIEEGRPGDAGAALAPLTYRLSVLVDTYASRRPVELRVPLERRPLSTNLRI